MLKKNPKWAWSWKIRFFSWNFAQGYSRGCLLRKIKLFFDLKFFEFLKNFWKFENTKFGTKKFRYFRSDWAGGIGTKWKPKVYTLTIIGRLPQLTTWLTTINHLVKKNFFSHEATTPSYESSLWLIFSAESFYDEY